VDIDKTVSSIENLLNSIQKASDIEKFQTYVAIKVISNELLKYVQDRRDAGDSIDHNSARGYLVELFYHLKTMVGLEDNGHSFEQNLLWVTGIIDKLRSCHCFDLQAPKEPR
jgi:hypothetical protein